MLYIITYSPTFISAQALCEYGTVVCYGGFKLCQKFFVTVKQISIIFT